MTDQRTLERIFDKLDGLSGSVAGIDAKQEAIKDSVGEVKEDIRRLPCVRHGEDIARQGEKIEAQGRSIDRVRNHKTLKSVVVPAGTSAGVLALLGLFRLFCLKVFHFDPLAFLGG